MISYLILLYLLKLFQCAFLSFSKHCLFFSRLTSNKIYVKLLNSGFSCIKLWQRNELCTGVSTENNRLLEVYGQEQNLVVHKAIEVAVCVEGGGDDRSFLPGYPSTDWLVERQVGDVHPLAPGVHQRHVLHTVPEAGPLQPFVQPCLLLLQNYLQSIVMLTFKYCNRLFQRL
jgi:hypothetical protein